MWLSLQGRANARTAPCMLLMDHPALRDLRHLSPTPDDLSDQRKGTSTPGSSDIEGSPSWQVVRLLAPSGSVEVTDSFVLARTSCNQKLPRV